MKTTLLLLACAVAVGFSACNDTALPTDAERDMLNNPAGAPPAGASKYGQIFSELAEDEYAVALDSIIDLQDPVGPSDKQLPGYVHIRDEHNHSKYKPSGYEHINDSYNKTSYKPAGWLHRSATKPAIDRTKYQPKYYIHIPTGPDETRYHRNPRAPQVGTVGEEPVEEYMDQESIGEETTP